MRTTTIRIGDVVTLLDFVGDLNPNSPPPGIDVVRLERYLSAVLAQLF
jgi:hypothetical protein